MRLVLRKCHQPQRNPELLPRQPITLCRLSSLNPVPDLHARVTWSARLSVKDSLPGCGALQRPVQLQGLVRFALRKGHQAQRSAKVLSYQPTAFCWHGHLRSTPDLCKGVGGLRSPILDCALDIVRATTLELCQTQLRSPTCPFPPRIIQHAFLLKDISGRMLIREEADTNGSTECHTFSR